jgi:hypothetical protein
LNYCFIFSNVKIKKKKKREGMPHTTISHSSLASLISFNFSSFILISFLISIHFIIVVLHTFCCCFTLFLMAVVLKNIRLEESQLQLIVKMTSFIHFFFSNVSSSLSPPLKKKWFVWSPKMIF